MDPKHPLSAKRLHALLGDRMLDFPPHFIERLERRLEEYETSRSRGESVVHLRLVANNVENALQNTPEQREESAYASRVAVPMRTLQGLACVLDLLHAAYTARINGITNSGISERHVEGLLLAGQALVSDAAQTAWRSQ
ncbi:hypothetical protein [Stenotrophomonas lacuserhaii]|uniref:hypothetical protein n=2 Tax=Stenotrophomonas TaxID=40323 RepID=UPI0015FBEE44|nr:hypothetical protein [Stenotrophomonas lacuserhaii]